MFRRWVVPAILMGAVGACGPFCGNGKLNLSNAHINPTAFTCASGVQDFGYDIGGSFDADNQEGKLVTIKSMSDDATVSKLSGSWSIGVGDKSSAVITSFSPKKVESGQKTMIKFTMPWNCTNPGGNGPNVFADFKVVLSVVTDSGTYKINLPNHRMKMA